LDMKTYAQRAEMLRPKLYRTALCWLGDPCQAVDVLDEAVYRGLCAAGKLREPDYFDTWLTRILLNECHREQARRGRLTPLEHAEELTAEQFDSLPLKQALSRLPEDLKNVIILRFFAGYTQAETADILKLPQGTVATRQQRALRLLRLELEVET
jgi:RNA polymerase sigma-70 factor (ECF subfamily)